MRTRRTIRRHLRNFTVILLMILAFCSGFFGHTLLNARAEEKARPEWNRYYTSVQIRQGDSLWNLSDKYRQGSGYSRQEYIDELKRIKIGTASLRRISDGRIFRGIICRLHIAAVLVIIRFVLLFILY